MLLRLHGRLLPPAPFSSAAAAHLPSPPDTHSAASPFDLLLQQCTTPRQAKQVHAQILSSSAHHSAFLSARLVSAYSRLGLLPDARSAFRAAPCHRTSLLWNSILRATISHGHPRETLSLYHQMRSLGALPDTFTLPLILRACAILGDPRLCVSVHTHSFATGHYAHLHVANELVVMYGNIGRMDLALQVFDAMPLRNVVSWNTLISGFSLNCECEGARAAFRRMESMGHEPNPVTWTSLLSAHARSRRQSEVIDLFEEMRSRGSRATAETVAVALSACPYIGGTALQKGKKIHGLVARSSFEGYPFVTNSLVSMYGKLGSRGEAEMLFSETEVKDLVSWNALISSYAAAGLSNEAYEVFIRMEKTAMVVPNVVSWSAVIGGFASTGMVEQSLDLFRQMQQAGVPPNSVTAATILSACAELSALRLGREIHGHTIRASMDQNLLVGNGLLNMYNKSGSLRLGRLVFERIEEKDLISWNSMIAGYGMHGLCEGALRTFDDMVTAGLEPDAITFIAVLSACSHAGCLSDGRRMFDRMIHEYKVRPSMEHYSCMVDLLGRAGLLREASELVGRMPMKPNVCIWGALLNSCRIHGNTAVAEETLTRIGGIEEEFAGNYMLLSNIYAASGRWEDSARVRVLTRRRGLKKSPGQSWIEVRKKVYVFSAGSLLPAGAVEAYGVLEDLSHQIESENLVSMDWIELNGEGEGDGQWINVYTPL